jgi:hypothetical protein
MKENNGRIEGWFGLLQSSGGGFTLSLINAEEENEWVVGWNADCSEFISGFGLIRGSSRIWKEIRRID